MNEYQRRQVEWHEREHYRADSPQVADNSHPAVAWLNTLRLQRMMAMLPEAPADRTVLSVCGGDGEEGDFLRRAGARVTVADLSRAGLAAARRRHPDLQTVLADTEHLPFPDDAFDWVVVRDGLYHLEHPLAGLREMARVARHGFAFLEGQNTWAVRLLVRLGLGANREPAGNVVYRFRRAELAELLGGLPGVAGHRAWSAWLPPGSDLLGHFPATRRRLLPAIDHPRVRPVLCSHPGRALLKGAFAAVQGLAGRWGNALVVVAWKKW